MLQNQLASKEPHLTASTMLFSCMLRIQISKMKSFLLNSTSNNTKVDFDSALIIATICIYKQVPKSPQPDSLSKISISVAKHQNHFFLKKQCANYVDLWSEYVEMIVMFLSFLFAYSKNCSAFLHTINSFYYIFFWGTKC